MSSFEAEIKAVQYQTDLLPPDMLRAMTEKLDHPNIGERGPVNQWYLNTTDLSLVRRTLDFLNRSGVPFGTPEEQEAFIKSGAIREFRYLFKPRQKIAQLTLKGPSSHAGLIRPQLETPENYSKAVRVIADRLRLIHQSRGLVRKMWHDLMFDINGQRHKVEHDLYASHEGLMIVETEVETASEAQAAEELKALQASGKLPAIFQDIVTDRNDLKAASIAINGVPADIQEKIARQSADNRAVIAKILYSNGIRPDFKTA